MGYVPDSIGIQSLCYSLPVPRVSPCLSGTQSLSQSPLVSRVSPSLALSLLVSKVSASLLWYPESPLVSPCLCWYPKSLPVSFGTQSLCLVSGVYLSLARSTYSLCESLPVSFSTESLCMKVPSDIFRYPRVSV